MAQTKSNGRHSAKSNGKTQPAAGAGNTQLEKFFHDALKDIYWAEKHLVKALGKMQKAATTDELKNAIEEHIGQTEGHVERLEQVFELFGKKPQAKKCEAMEGLTKEGESIVEETEEGSMTRDAGIILAAQKVEHYEIATYGTLRQLAITMGQDQIGKYFLRRSKKKNKQTQGLVRSQRII